MTELLLPRNKLTTLPPEVGHLFKIKFLQLEDNPLSEAFKTQIEQGTDALMLWLLDKAPSPSRVPVCLCVCLRVCVCVSVYVQPPLVAHICHVFFNARARARVCVCVHVCPPFLPSLLFPPPLPFFFVLKRCAASVPCGSVNHCEWKW